MIIGIDSSDVNYLIVRMSIKDLAWVILIPLNHLQDPRDLPVLTVLVAATKPRLQAFPDVSVAVPLLQELAGWQLAVQVIACILRCQADDLDVLLR